MKQYYVKKSPKKSTKKSIKKKSPKKSIKKKSPKKSIKKKSPKKSTKKLSKKSPKKSTKKLSKKSIKKKSTKKLSKKSIKKKSTKKLSKKSIKKKSPKKSTKKLSKKSIKKKSTKKLSKKSTKKLSKKSIKKKSPKKLSKKSIRKKLLKKSIRKKSKKTEKYTDNIKETKVYFNYIDNTKDMKNVFEINGPIDNGNKNLACFDYDWTICKPKGGKTFPSNKDDWQWLRVNIPYIFKKLNEDGYSIYIFTTQTKLWKIDMIKESLGTLNIPIKVIVGFGKENPIKKPNKALFYDNVKIKFDKNTSFFVGDAAGRANDHSDDDIVFAKNIGMKFKIPEDIFPIELKKKVDNNNYEKKEQEIIVLVGFPASGKTNFTNNKFSSYKILSGDILKTLPKMLKEARKYLDQDYSVVFDATNPKKESRAKIIELGKQYKIPVRCFIFNVDIETAFEWNTKRTNETGKHVPKISFYVFRKNYEKPIKEEGFKEIVEINS